MVDDTVDHHFVSFYNDVKDSSWPVISSYYEFLSLPKRIQDECREMHQLSNSMSIVYAPQREIKVCVQGNVAFVPIPKCAYAYYTTHLMSQGWKAVNISDLDTSSLEFVGMLMHPVTRYLKGLAQLFVNCHYKSDPIPRQNNPFSQIWDHDWSAIEQSLESQYAINLLSAINIGDVHVLPYNVMLNKILHITQWIPFDAIGDAASQAYLVKFCSDRGVSLKLDNQRIHQSPPLQISVFNRIKQKFHSDEEQRLQFYYTYGRDLQFYHSVLEKFHRDN